MSDYFAQLVERSRGLAEVARPRVASLFEPRKTEPATAFSRQSDLDWTEPLEGENLFSEVSVPRPKKSSLHANGQSAREGAHFPQLGFEDSSGAPPRSRPMHRRISQAGLEEEILRVDEHHKTPVAKTDSPVVNRQRAAAEIAEASKAEPAGVPPTNATPFAARARSEDSLKTTVSISATAAHVARRHSGLGNAEIAPNVAPSRAASENARHAPGSSIPKIFARIGPADRQEPQRTEPTVQVTIGRVEVRATLAEPRTRKEPKRTPAMTLEEYLQKKRSGAGR